MNIQVIGYVQCQSNEKYESPRQGIQDNEIKTLIIHHEYAIGLRSIEGFSRIWIVWGFHKNNTWKGIVYPPRAHGKGFGVFSTRSPYRPSGIGITPAKLLRVDKNILYITECDCLNGTPVFDIKPYLVYSDSFQNEKQGWLDEYNQREYKAYLSVKAIIKFRWIKESTNIDVACLVQKILKDDPYPNKSKRIKKEKGMFVYSLRKWRFHYMIYDDQAIYLTDITSNVNDDEVENEKDKVIDKVQLHKKFRLEFNQ